MPIDQLDPRTALVVIDLQRGITALPTVDPSADVVARSAGLAATFRDHGRLVVLVRTAFSPDGADLLRTPTDAPPPAVRPGPDFADLHPELGTGLVITKRQWDAFHGTELDLQLRRRGIAGFVLTGIATSIGVESTARHGRELGYAVSFAADAMTDLGREQHDNSIGRIFPRIGRVDTTARIAELLQPA